MAYIVESDCVKYACTCGLLKPISKLYFCRHCLDLRCEYCVCHEVDSHFCGKCLENLPSSEARLKKNKCNNCFDCPSCHQQLSTRAATTGTKNTDDPSATPKKVVYLLCLYCRWSTRDVGIPDQPVGNYNWPERENVYEERLHELREHYKALMLRIKKEKLEKDKRKQRKYVTLTDMTGVTASVLRKRLGLPDEPNVLLKKKPEPPPPAQAVEHVDELPMELLFKPINLNEITTAMQRLSLPDSQPNTVDKLHPIRKQLSIKRSLRCRSCEHNIIKPEYNASSIKFKIQLFAFYHIPEVRIFTVEPLRAGKECELLLKFINPTQHQTTITILPIDYVASATGDAATSTEGEAVGNEPTGAGDEGSITTASTMSIEPSSLQDGSASDQSASGGKLSSLLNSLFPRQPSVTIHPRSVETQATGTIELPTSSFILSQRDDAAEFDEANDAQNYQDDPKLVVFRKSNKATIRLIVTPNSDLKLGEDVIVGFTMRHIYKNTIVSTIENKRPLICDHHVRVYLNLGQLVGSD